MCLNNVLSQRGMVQGRDRIPGTCAKQSRSIFPEVVNRVGFLESSEGSRSSFKTFQNVNHNTPFNSIKLTLAES